MVRTLILLGLLMTTMPIHAVAQDIDRKYVAGIRSALITGTLKLSGLDPAFDDLAADGPEGPHMSGFFLLYKVHPHVRIGFETLVANSDQNAVTTMNYQAAGPVVELSYGRSWFVSGGVHMGGLIVNAMARQGAAPPEGAAAGTFYKGNGLFVAPTLDIGYRFRRLEVGLMLKQVNIFGEEDRGGLSAFSSPFVGLRIAVGL
jgi:hypothetical protein